MVDGAQAMHAVLAALSSCLCSQKYVTESIEQMERVTSARLPGLLRRSTPWGTCAA